MTQKKKTLLNFVSIEALRPICVGMKRQKERKCQEKEKRGLNTLGAKMKHQKGQETIEYLRKSHLRFCPTLLTKKHVLQAKRTDYKFLIMNKNEETIYE